jgi:hypothetical protein
MVTHFRHTTVGRTPLDEGPARRRDLYLTPDVIADVISTSKLLKMNLV